MRASGTRPKVERAALELFAAKGFNGTTTREIAKTAGISEALVFKYFPTKRALYAAILSLLLGWRLARWLRTKRLEIKRPAFP